MKRLKLGLAALLVASLVAGCGGDAIRATANFDDVGDLAEDAPVTMADIQVGKVSDIRLAGNEARVTVELDPGARVPQDITIRVRRTSVLGERILDIVVPEDLPESAPLLADGAHITRTEVRSDLENLVAEGVDVFGAIGASELAIMINEGGRGFGGRGQELRNLLSNYRDIVTVYAGRSKGIVKLIRSLRGFNETLAAKADDHALSVQNAARSISMLEEESVRLESAIISLNRLAKGAYSLMNEHLGRMKRFYSQARVILGVLAHEQGALRNVLRWAPGHNYNTQAVEYTEFNQVIQDFVFCGLNDDPKDPARNCEKDGEGRR
ncbi:MAG: MlaD family protein [Actinomycetota bacterium]